MNATISRLSGNVRGNLIYLNTTTDTNTAEMLPGITQTKNTTS